VAEKWARVTWAFVEPGDFVRRVDRDGAVGSEIYRVDEALSNGEVVTLTLYTPTYGVAAGLRKVGKPVMVRIVKNGERTPAGKRDDGLTDEGERALREKLGAELIATQDLTGRTFQPYVVPARMDAPSLASHLFLFHELYTGEVKAKDGVELRKAHAAFHAADAKTQPETARRLPHVHDDNAFKEGQ